MSDRGNSPNSAPSSRPGSSAGPPGSRGVSPSGRPASAGEWPESLGFDPARDKPHAREMVNTRMEVPPEAYLLDSSKSIFAMRGNRYNSAGKPIKVALNSYRIKKFNFSKKIHQFDVSVNPMPSKPGPVFKKILEHPTFKAKFPVNRPGSLDQWIFDGKKLAWAPECPPGGELRIQVDLDEGRPAPPNASSGKRSDNKFFVIIRKTTEVHVDALQGYLEKKISMNNTVLEAMNFVDHLLRAWPSKNLLSIKRSFFDRQAPTRPLQDGAVVEVRKGLYWSARICNTPGLGMAINADVTNTCFFVAQDFIQLACNFLALQDRRYQGLNGQTLQDALRPVSLREGRWEQSDAMKHLRRLVRLRFLVKHANRPEHLKDQVISVESFMFDERFGRDGANANTVTFSKDGKTTSVADYFRSAYRVNLRFPNLPLIKAPGKKGTFPMELCHIEPYQQYRFKLTPDQTAAMIKIAVTRPKQRRADIERNVQSLKIGQDPYLRQYGMEIEPYFATTDARLLPPVTVQFKVGACSPGTSGRWDLRGKKFAKANQAPLDSWGFLVMDNCVNLPTLQAFAKSFRQTFQIHGGNSPKDAKLMNPPGNVARDIAMSIAWAFEELKKERGYPQLLFIVVRQKNSPHYERAKKNCDVRFGILSQVVNSQAVQQNNGQYHSNVCMKVNAKLGGATSTVAPPWRSQQYFPPDRPTMVLGLDISHGPPGSSAASTAAMTCSLDPDCNRFAAICQTNGQRLEILTAANTKSMFGQLFGMWRPAHGGKVPQNIILFRDGVSEGEFSQVIDREVKEIKAYIAEGMRGSSSMPRFMVIVATKRHHLRIFPERGDKNDNALPGTLVEREVTHPHHLQFLLSSHSAIQGTARPTLYTVLVDEVGMPINDLQRMIYDQCYSYARSTTPVSIHPAIYYAHLAAARSRAHENIAASSGPRSGGKGHEMAQLATAMGGSREFNEEDTEVAPLLPVGGQVPENKNKTPELHAEARQRQFTRNTMWFI